MYNGTRTRIKKRTCKADLLIAGSNERATRLAGTECDQRAVELQLAAVERRQVPVGKSEIGKHRRIEACHPVRRNMDHIGRWTVLPQRTYRGLALHKTPGAVERRHHVRFPDCSRQCAVRA